MENVENVVPAENNQYNVGEKYIPKGVTTTIQISSRASKKIGDDYYTLEYVEERTIPEGANVELERQALWETCNNEVDRALYETWQAVTQQNNN